jgi:uncharacterized membrane protein
MESIVMMFLWIPLLFLVPVAIVWLMRPELLSGAHASAPQPAAAPARDEALQIARRRLALGEITPVEFDEIRRAIS